MKNRFLHIKFLIINLIFLYLILNNSYFLSQEIDCEEAKKKYLVENPDVAKAGMDAWNHYKIFGKKEGRKWPECNFVMNSLTNQNVNENFNTKNNIAFLKFDIPTEFLSRKKIIDKKLIDFGSLMKTYDSLTKEINFYNTISLPEPDSLAYRFIMNKLNVIYVFKNSTDAPYYKKLNKSFTTSIGLDDFSLFWWYRLALPYRMDSLVFFQNKNGRTVFGDQKGFTRLFKQNSSSNFKIIDEYLQSNNKKEVKKVLSLIKKYRDIILIKEENRIKLAKRLTGLDENFFRLVNERNRIQNKINLLSNSYKILINDYYFYFGEKTDGHANGFGYLISKSIENNPIVIVAEWLNDYPIKIMETYLYSNMHNIGDSPSLVIKKSNSNDRVVIDKNGLTAGSHNGNKFNGSNVLALFNNGSYFSGNYINGVYADGLFVYANGDKYLGGHDSDGKRNGFGKYFWPNGSYYEGEWYNNLENGYGKLVYSNGAVSEGIWQNNTLVKSKETIEQEKRAAEEMRIAEQKRIQEEENQRKARERNEELGSILAFQMLMGEFDKEYKKMGGKHVPICQNRKCGKQFKKENGWSCDDHETAIKGVNVGRSVLGGMLTGNSDIIFPDYCSLRCARDDGKCW